MIKETYIAVLEEELATLTDKEYRKVMHGRMKARHRKAIIRKVRRCYHRNRWWLEFIGVILLVICLAGGFYAYTVLMIIFFG